MKIRCYHFAKRNRSTYQPPANFAYDEKEIVLKEGCNITKPVILFQTVQAVAYNYFYIPDWGRYYFLSEGKIVENMYEVSLIEDYLASFKTDIGSTSASILYATGSTKNIPDSRIPVTADLSINHAQSAINNLTITTGSGAVILGITGKGSFGAYLMQNSTLISELLDGVDIWQQVSSWQDEIDGWKQFFYGGSASECLKSALALPLVIGGSDVGSGTAENLYLGGYPCTDSGGTNITGYKITSPILSRMTTISIPWNYSDWRNVSQYTNVVVYLPFIGLITLPATELIGDSSLSIQYSFNLTSGDIAVSITGSTSGRIFATASGNCAMNTAYGSIGIDTNRATSAIVSGVGTLIAGAAALESGGISALLSSKVVGAGLLSTAMNTIGALGGNGSGSGGLGGGASQGLDTVIHVWCISKQLSESQSNLDPLIGKPYMGVSTPSAFSGYVQTDGFQLASSIAYSSERDAINQLLDSGIYYE